jgi:hypothetical protein
MEGKTMTAKELREDKIRMMINKYGLVPHEKCGVRATQGYLLERDMRFIQAHREEFAEMLERVACEDDDIATQIRALEGLQAIREAFCAGDTRAMTLLSGQYPRAGYYHTLEELMYLTTDYRRRRAYAGALDRILTGSDVADVQRAVQAEIEEGVVA